MPNSQLKPWGSLLSEIAIATFTNRPLRLGIIPDGNSVSQVDINNQNINVIGAEYNLNGWQRPTVTLNVMTLGSYELTNNQFKVNPTNNKWTVIAPSGGFSIKHLFAILDGSPDSRDMTGTIVGFTTLATPIVMAANSSQDFRMDWAIKGVV